MLIPTLRQIFQRDLTRLKTEIELYTNEEAIWKIDEGIANSGGNLCLHLLGNLNTYIAAEIGVSGYVRDRPLEFSAKNVATAELLSRIELTIVEVDNALSKLTEAQLQEEYPLLVFENKTSYEYLLVHLTTHLCYHLGQINYHRRLIDR